ncbi:MULTISPECIES: YkvA family protein [unclassified Variovorax]|uniref:YkvA family protein n=1 Tax=unclassified Variovorax TaxID=663243 RepID=UPI003F45D0DB
MNPIAWSRRCAGTLLALCLSGLHRDTPREAKAIWLFVLVYAASPVDWTPDVLPMPSYLDDLVLLTLLSWLSSRMLPRAVWQECRAKSDDWIGVCAGWLVRASTALMLAFALSAVAGWLWLWFVALSGR